MGGLVTRGEFPWQRPNLKAEAECGPRPHARVGISTNTAFSLLFGLSSARKPIFRSPKKKKTELVENSFQCEDFLFFRKLCFNVETVCTGNRFFLAFPIRLTPSFVCATLSPKATAPEWRAEAKRC